MAQQFVTARIGSRALTNTEREMLNGLGIESKDEGDAPQVLHIASGWWRAGTRTNSMADSQINFYSFDGDPGPSTGFGDGGACELCVVPTAVNTAGSGNGSRVVADVKYWDEGFYLPPGTLLTGTNLSIKVRGNIRNNTGGTRTLYAVIDPDSNVRVHGATGVALGTWAADAANDQLDHPDGAAAAWYVYSGQRIEVWDAGTTGLSTSTLYYAKAIDADADGLFDAIELYTDLNLEGTKVTIAAGNAIIATASNVFGSAANTSNVVTVTAHGLTSGDPVHVYDKGAGVPTGSSEHTTYYASVASADTFSLYVEPTLTTVVALSSDVSGFGVRRRPCGSKYATVLSFTVPDTGIGSRTGYELDISGVPDTGNSTTATETKYTTWTGNLSIGTLTQPGEEAGGSRATVAFDQSTAGVQTYDWGPREILQYEADPSATISADMYMVGGTSNARGIVIEHDTLKREIHYAPITKGTRFRFGETITCYTTANPTGGNVTSISLQDDTLTVGSHTLSDDDEVMLFANPRSVVPGGFTEGVSRFVVNKTSSTIQLAATLGGDPIDITSVGSANVVKVSGAATFVAKTRQLGTGTLVGLRFAVSGTQDAQASACEFNVHTITVVAERIKSRGS